MLRCLIVDDSPTFLDDARALLERQGISVVGVANNSAEALRCAHQLGPDVTLVDINLGDASGFELVHRLHSESAREGSRVILISTYAEQDYADLIAASPAVGFLPKVALSATAIIDLLTRADQGEERKASSDINWPQGTSTLPGRGGDHRWFRPGPTW